MSSQVRPNFRRETSPSVNSINCSTTTKEAAQEASVKFYQTDSVLVQNKVSPLSPKCSTDVQWAVNAASSVTKVNSQTISTRSSAGERVPAIIKPKQSPSTRSQTRERVSLAPSLRGDWSYQHNTSNGSCTSTPKPLVSQRAFAFKGSTGFVIIYRAVPGRPGRLVYHEFPRQEEERQQQPLQHRRGLFGQNPVAAAIEGGVSSVRARARAVILYKLMQRRQVFKPNQNDTPPDGDDREESGGQWAIFDGTQAASSSRDFDRAIEDGGRSRPGTSVAAVMDEPANKQLPHAPEGILPAPRSGPSAATTSQTNSVSRNSKIAVRNRGV